MFPNMDPIHWEDLLKCEFPGSILLILIYQDRVGPKNLRSWESLSAAAGTHWLWEPLTCDDPVWQFGVGKGFVQNGTTEGICCVPFWRSDPNHVISTIRSTQESKAVIIAMSAYPSVFLIMPIVTPKAASSLSKWKLFSALLCVSS